MTYVLLLGAALFHGFYGLRNILFELNPGAAAKKAVNGFLLIAGLVLFAVGHVGGVGGDSRWRAAPDERR